MNEEMINNFTELIEIIEKEFNSKAMIGIGFNIKKGKVKDIHQKLTPALSKVTLSKPNASDIWNNMSVGTCIVNKTNSGVLIISLPVSLKKPFDLDVPEGINMVIDGTIKGEVWFEDNYVGNVFFPLPIFGIMNNSCIIMKLKIY